MRTIRHGNSELLFRKSSYSNGSGECVEVADVATGGTAVRDSKFLDGEVLKFPASAWASFVQNVKGDGFIA